MTKGSASSKAATPTPKRKKYRKKTGHQYNPVVKGATQKEVKKLHSDLYDLKNPNLTYVGSLPRDANRVTQISKMSYKGMRNIQLLRHMCIHILKYCNRFNYGAVEVQAAYLADIGLVLVTANVGEAVDYLEEDEIDNIQYFYKQMKKFIQKRDEDILAGKKVPSDNTMKVDVKRISQKMDLVIQGKRKSNDRHYADLAEIVRDGDVEYVNVDKCVKSGQIVFIKHEHTKEKGGVRHAEQILVEYITNFGYPGMIYVAGTKIPCGTCYSELKVWGSHHELVYIDMAGALFKNTVNKHMSRDSLNKVREHAKTLSHNSYSEVASDSEAEDKDDLDMSDTDSDDD